MDVRRLLKVYNYVNNEKRPKVNLKFLGALAAFLLAGGALIAFAVVQNRSGAPTGPDAAAKTCPERSEYVGLSTDEFASAPYNAQLPQQRLDTWKAQHPGATITHQEPVTDPSGAVTYGWNLRYVPASC